jgi:hypothetical protein
MFQKQIIFRQKFSGNDYNDIISHPTINLSEVQKNNEEDKCYFFRGEY